MSAHVPLCPMCGRRLRAADDWWYCPKCGSEWDPDLIEEDGMTDRDMEIKAGIWARAAQLLEERADRPVADTVELFRWLAEQHQRIAASEAVDW